MPDVEEFRCPSRIHGVIEGEEFVVKCHSKRCGAGGGTVVLHYFNLYSQQLDRTQKFRDAAVLKTKIKEEAPCP